MLQQWFNRLEWSWWFRWTRILGSFAGGQLLVQAMNALSGFLLIRHLPKEHYAWFTLANTLGAAVSMLSDSGTTVALTARSGDCWKDSKRFADLIAAGLIARGRLFSVVAVVAAPWTWYLLYRGECPAWASTGLVTLGLFGVLPATRATVLQIVNRMRSQFRAILTADIIMAGSRLSLVALIVFGPWQTALAAAATVGVSQWLQYNYVKRVTISQVPWYTGDPRFDQTAIWRTIRQFSPNSIFTCIQGALAPWLIGFFANTHAIADLGALTRFAIVFSIIGSPIHQIVGPGFARCQSKRRLRQLAVRIVGTFLLCSLCIVVTAVLFPNLFLVILGHQYSHLDKELFAVICLQALSGVNQLFWGLAMARGWVKNAWIQIPIALACQSIAAFLADPSEIVGVVWISTAAVTAQMLVGAVLLTRGVAQFRDSPNT